MGYAIFQAYISYVRIYMQKYRKHLLEKYGDAYALHRCTSTYEIYCHYSIFDSMGLHNKKMLKGFSFFCWQKGFP